MWYAVRFGRLYGNFWIEVRRIDGRIGYIAFNNFMHPLHVMKAFNEAMASFMDAEGLVIDLRGNTGGMGAMAMGMMGWLVEGEEDIGTLRLRELTLDLEVRPRPETYTGPVAVLVDGLSCSAAEFFSGGLLSTGAPWTLACSSPGPRTTASGCCSLTRRFRHSGPSCRGSRKLSFAQIERSLSQ